MEITSHEQQALLDKIYKPRGPLLDHINHVAPWHALYRRRTLETLKNIASPTSRVLDLAAGTGILARELAPLVSEITLVDCLQSMIELAKDTLVRERGLRNVEFVLANITSSDVQLPRGEYDLVLLTQAANFLTDLEPVFKLAAKSLLPSGYFYFDIDTAFRWITIEAFSGHLNNALEIATTSKDAARNIVGADYTFHSLEAIQQAASQAGFSMVSSHGICQISTLIHIFNQSSDFLEPEKLDYRSIPFLSNQSLERLYELDLEMEAKMPPEVGGWAVFLFTKDEP